MAAPSTYYIDTNDFSTAASVWTDLNLTIKAPDGFYSFFGNYRQQLNGILLEIDSCTPTPCVINQYTFTSTGDGASWSFYTTCDNNSLTTITLSGNDSINMCGRAPILQSGTGSVTDDGPCATCFFYDVVVEQIELNMSDDDTVYFGYTNCSGVYQVNSQNNAGSYTNQFCGTNFSGAYIIQNGIQSTGGSTANVTNTPCT